MNKMHAKVEVPTPNENTKRIAHSFQCNLTENIAKMARKSVFKSKFRGLCTSVWNYPKLFIDTVTQIFCVPVFDIMRVILEVPR